MSCPLMFRIIAFLDGTTRGLSRAMEFAPLNGGPTVLLSQYLATHSFASPRREEVELDDIVR